MSDVQNNINNPKIILKSTVQIKLFNLELYQYRVYTYYICYNAHYNIPTLHIHDVHYNIPTLHIHNVHYNIPTLHIHNVHYNIPTSHIHNVHYNIPTLHT